MSFHRKLVLKLFKVVFLCWYLVMRNGCKMQMMSSSKAERYIGLSKDLERQFEHFPYKKKRMLILLLMNCAAISISMCTVTILQTFYKLLLLSYHHSHHIKKSNRLNEASSHQLSADFLENDRNPIINFSLHYPCFHLSTNYELHTAKSR